MLKGCDIHLQGKEIDSNFYNIQIKNFWQNLGKVKITSECKTAAKFE